MGNRIVFAKQVPALSFLSQGDLEGARRSVGDVQRGHARESRDNIGLRNIVGGVDMVGLRSIIGKSGMNALINAGVIRTTAVQSGEVVEREPEDLKRKILPIPLTTIDTDETVRIILRPQELFKAKRLVVDPTIAEDFRLQNAMVATRQQFSGPGAVPCAVFSPNAFDVNIDWDSCDVGEEISLEVTNFGGGETPLVFSGCFLGSSVY
jgi:hypothetical protein